MYDRLDRISLNSTRHAPKRPVFKHFRKLNGKITQTIYEPLTDQEENPEPSLGRYADAVFKANGYPHADRVAMYEAYTAPGCTRRTFVKGLVHTEATIAELCMFYDFMKWAEVTRV